MQLLNDNMHLIFKFITSYQLILLMVYQTKNACSHRPSILCVITITLYLGITVLHIFYILIPITKGKISQNPILYVLVALHFILLAVIVFDYLWIAVHDPVDRIVYDAQLSNRIQPQYLDHCSICNAKRLIGSHHCSKCERCTQQFDHHCQYINNCIGSKNYQKFLRLLSMNCIFHINLIGQAIWVFVRAHSDKRARQTVPQSYWVVLGIMIISAILLITIFILLIFHCYISCILGETTLEYLFGRHSNQNHKLKKNKTNNVPQQNGQRVETQRQIL